MSDRRTFLRNPKAVAVPATREMLESYKSWLFMEHRMLSFELAGYDVQVGREMERQFMSGTPGDAWHFNWPNPNGRLAGWEAAPQPSTRAAVILSAAGVPLTW